jgi:transcriptional regulator with XRE-family HTH domain
MNIIKEIRKEQNLSIKFISQILNITQKTYKRFENNEITLNKEKLTLLYKLLGITTEDLNRIKKEKNLTKDEIEMSKLLNYK